MKGKTLGLIFFFLVLLGVLVATIVGGFAWWHIIHAPGEEISQKNIRQILAVESPVFCNDGVTKLGVFFEDAHRQYVPFEEMPQHFINAIVAAEDQNFFSHFGIDFSGVLRAFIANIRAGRVVQGGSTITQQAAKNLFKRKSRSVAEKLKEMLFALRLEYHYPKEKILEFYANQFYVSGNGHGLGVAARYYFNKEVRDLTLLESAFIAGSVKRPNYYNPFIKKTKADADAARHRARIRTGYVLKQMRAAGMITRSQYVEAYDHEIPFQPGTMFFDTTVILDLVKDFLESPTMEELLAENGIENISTSGIRIFTSIDNGIQQQAEQATKRRLSELDVRLAGYARNEVQKTYQSLPSLHSKGIAPGDFAFARVTALNRTAAPTVEIRFLSTKSAARIDTKGLMHIVQSLVKWQRQRWSEPTSDDLDAFLDQLRPGDLVYVSVRATDPVFGITCNLEKYPLIQGAVTVLQNGQVRAMVGGFDNRFYNRAVHAKRSMGSIFKPLVYAAALQLGWNPLDMLNNSRDVFLYQRLPYFPRPDHHSPHEKVSMSWAGVNSENLATIWLLYHLCDRLTPGQFQEMLDHINLGRKNEDGFEDSYTRYAARIRDQLGVLVDDAALQEAAFRRAVRSLEPDLLFTGKMEEVAFLQKLHFGRDFALFRQEKEAAIATKRNTPELKNDPETTKELQELAVQLQLLQSSYLDLLALSEKLPLRAHMGGHSPAVSPEPFSMPDYSPEQEQDDAKERPALFYRHRHSDLIAFSDVPLDEENWQQRRAASLLSSVSAEEIEPLRENILLHGKISVATFEMITAQMEKEFLRLTSLPPYSPEVLREIADFRIAAGLRYLVRFCQTLGIESTLEPVLSFPLGSNVVSLLETARATQSLLLGKRIDFLTPTGHKMDHPGTYLIDRIETKDGVTIYQANPNQIPTADPITTLSIRDILRNIVTFGTGRLARDNVRMTSKDQGRNTELARLNLPVPLYGKTGTANDYANAAFTGYLPGVAPDTSGLMLSNGFTVTAYVGFDDNRSMKRTSSRMTGASGALPLWSDVVNAILFEKQYDQTFDIIDLTFQGGIDINPSSTVNDVRRVPVDPQRGGLPLSFNEKQMIDETIPGITAAIERTPGGDVVPARHFAPFWREIAAVHTASENEH